MGDGIADRMAGEGSVNSLDLSLLWIIEMSVQNCKTGLFQHKKQKITMGPKSNQPKSQNSEQTSNRSDSISMNKQNETVAST